MEDASESEASVSSKLSSEESLSTRCLRGALLRNTLGGLSDAEARLYIDVGSSEGVTVPAVIGDSGPVVEITGIVKPA